MRKSAVSKQTRNNWLLDTVLLTSGLLAAISAIYFLFLPVGGYRGGRNPWYDIQILFSRHTWDDLHTWSGATMIIIAVIHLVLHWSWLTSMARRALRELSGQSSGMNSRGRWNLTLNLIVAISFILTAFSGVYFLFIPGGQWVAHPMILFTQTTWDLIHTWAGIVLIAAAVVHFVIHWRWVVKVTHNLIGTVTPTGTAQRSIPVVNS
jgi:hypothetical protein